MPPGIRKPQDFSSMRRHNIWYARILYCICSHFLPPSNFDRIDIQFSARFVVKFPKRRLLLSASLFKKPRNISNYVFHFWDFNFVCVRTITQPKVLLHLSNNKKSTTNSLEFRSNFLEFKSKYPDHVAVYTDGSKDGYKVGCASVSDFHTSKARLRDNSSIFSAEVQAIYLALNFIASNNNRDFIIFSDSLSVLKFLKNRNFSNPLVQQLFIKHHKLSSHNNILLVP